MNKLVQEQLNKVQIADLSNYNKDTNEFIIKKRVDIKLEVNNCYIIEVSDAWRMNKLLANNLNKGIMLEHSCIKAVISQIAGKMIYVSAIGFDKMSNSDIPYFWEGWIPLSEISILRKE